MSDVLKRLDEYLIHEAEIDWEEVKKAAKDAAKDIHGKPDESVIDSMIKKVKDKGTAKDTEDAVQIVINMMRAGS